MCLQRDLKTMGKYVKMCAFWFSLPLWLIYSVKVAYPDVKPGCNSMCGNVKVPYPFGIGDGCAFNNSFLLKCDHNSATPLLFDKYQVHNISVENGTISISVNGSAYVQCNRNVTDNDDDLFLFINITDPFRFSSSHNTFMTFGCGILGYMEGENTASVCWPYCNDNTTSFTNSKKTGVGPGFCETPVPSNLQEVYFYFTSYVGKSSSKDSIKHYSCASALLTDKRTKKISDWKSYIAANASTHFPLADTVIEWAIGDKDCNENSTASPSYYNCSKHAHCAKVENVPGYRCLCDDGFFGNPYLPNGCQDINECSEPGNNRCDGTCKNTFGNYTCSCPLGMYSDGKFGCKGLDILDIALVILAVISVIIIGLLLVIMYNKRRKQRKFLENGGLLLKHQRVKIFTEKELAKATRNYDSSQFVGEGGFGTVYKGVLDDGTRIAVKKPKKVDKAQLKNEDFLREIQMVLQVNHKNVVKLLGLCLETEVPYLVYEFISNGTLYQHIHGMGSQLLTTWKHRLRIAAESALAFEYLHSLAEPPIIHGDVKSTNILLDDNFTAKVSDFGASLLTSSNHTVTLTKIQGTPGYIDPEYLSTYELTDKSDVYSFGVVLVELLTGEKPNSMRNKENMNIIHFFRSSLDINKISEILHFEVNNDEEMREIKIVAELARRCLGFNGKERPTMKEIAEELANQLKLPESWQQQNTPPDTCSMTTFSVEYSADSV